MKRIMRPLYMAFGVCILGGFAIANVRAQQLTTGTRTVGTTTNFRVTPHLRIASLVTLNMETGALTYHDGYTPDAAARAFWAAMTSVKQGTLPLELTDELLAAIDLRCPPVPGASNPSMITLEGNPQPSADDILATRVACVTRTVTTEFRAELETVRATRAAAVLDKIKLLNPAKCAALAKDTGVALSSLQCGGVE